MSNDLLKLDSHFAFGENWASYAHLIGESEVAEASVGLRRLVGDLDLRGQRFLDIGSGSGIHSLAALRLGVAEVVATDIDPQSVATTKAVLDSLAPAGTHSVLRCSVFDLGSAQLGSFDVVYSWGVLHHTGDMVAALRQAASMVKDGGVFIFALYRRTHLCGFWKWEKRWYSSASLPMQKVAQNVYFGWLRLIFALVSARKRLRTMFRQTADVVAEDDGGLDSYIDTYRAFRGMDFRHDMHDWLGGFPYESALPDDVDLLMTECGLRHRASYLCTKGRGKTHGLLGSGCDEYVYVK